MSVSEMRAKFYQKRSGQVRHMHVAYDVVQTCHKEILLNVSFVLMKTIVFIMLKYDKRILLETFINDTELYLYQNIYQKVAVLLSLCLASSRRAWRKLMSWTEEKFLMSVL